MKYLAALIAGLLLLAPSTASAGGRFGKSEQIERIAPVALVGPRGERLFLAHKVTTFWVIAGAYLKDEGYVLGVEGDDKSYYSLSPDKMALAQNAGLLPNPLPTYEISTADYLLGYSLWPLLVFAIAWVWIRSAWQRSRAITRRLKSGTIAT